MYKAECVGETVANEYGKKVLYKSFRYRGYEYMVRYAGWSAASDDEPYMQHKREQQRIDQIIDWQKKPTKQTKQEETVEYAMNMFMDYVNGDGE